MGRNKRANRWKRNDIFRNQGNLEMRSANRFPLSSSVQHVTDNVDIPGFYFDPETQTYFRITAENSRYFEEKMINAKLKKPLGTSMGKSKHTNGRLCKISDSITCEIIGREYQQVKNSDFCKRIINTRLRMMKEVYCTQLPDIDFIPESCQIMVGNPSCGSIVGAWKTEEGTVLYNHRFINKHRKSLCLSVETSILGIFFQHVMTDLCVVKLPNGLECVLFGGNPARPHPISSANQNTMHLYPIRELSDMSTPENVFAFNSMTLNIEQRESVIWSCAWNQNTQNIVFGCEGSVMLMSLQNPELFFTRLFLPRENVFSLGFNSTGNVLYCGTNKGNLKVFDLRSEKLISTIKLVRGLSYLKLLSCDQYAVASCYDHKLFQVDLRTNKVVVEYLEHNNEHLKLPFSVSERNGYLCSVGQDKFIRIWNLKDGNLIFTSTPDQYRPHHPYAWFSEEWSFCNGSFDTALIVNAGNEYITYMP